MTIKIEFNERLDKEEIKRIIIRENIGERICDVINRNMGGLRITNYKGEEVYTIIIEEE